eukprot:SAG25_NODE_9789_length_357_cov_81.023256_1_plen_23_part_01
MGSYPVRSAVTEISTPTITYSYL